MYAYTCTQSTSKSAFSLCPASGTIPRAMMPWAVWKPSHIRSCGTWLVIRATSSPSRVYTSASGVHCSPTVRHCVNPR